MSVLLGMIALQERVVIVEWVAGGLAGGKDGTGARVWVYWRYFDWVDWVGDWGMDFYAVGDCAYEYVFVFTGGGYDWGGAAGVGGSFVFWGEELGEEAAGEERKRITQRSRR